MPQRVRYRFLERSRDGREPCARRTPGPCSWIFRFRRTTASGRTPKKGRGRAAKPATEAAPRRPGRTASSAVSTMSTPMSRYGREPPRGQAGARPRPKVKKTRGRREKQAADARAASSGKLFYWLLMLGIWGGIAVAGVVVYFAVQLPSADTWAIPERPANIRILAANGQLISNRGKTGGEAVSLRELPYYVPAAFIAIEDRRFYEHFGIDVLGLVSVALESVQAGEVTRGASTITQQLAKNLFLTPDQTLQRKVQEALLAALAGAELLQGRHPRALSQPRVLRPRRLRHRGGGADLFRQIGPQPVARRGGDPRRLAAGALARSIRKSDPKAGQARQSLVLQPMAKEGYISDAEAKAAAIDPNQRIRTKVTGAESYVADWVESLMTAYIGDVDQDVVVYDHHQLGPAEASRVRRQGSGRNRGRSQGLQPGRAGRDGRRRHGAGAGRRRRLPAEPVQPRRHRRAASPARRSSRSSISRRWRRAIRPTPSPTTRRSPTRAGARRTPPASTRGPVTLRQALAYSLNTVSGRLAIDVGPDRVVEAAMRMGISSPMLAVPSIALGTSGSLAARTDRRPMRRSPMAASASSPMSSPASRRPTARCSTRRSRPAPAR